MDFLWSLFNSRRNDRHFARVDASGICHAFKQCRQPPQGQDWVEITEQKLCWLGNPLPNSARVIPRPERISPLRLYAA
jgi:hypothetical protein